MISAPRDDQQPSCGTAPLSILCVDDHRDTLVAIERLLRLEGHQVYCAATCGEALEVARREALDLLIADLGLPDGDGITLLSRIRALRPVEGIVLSGFGMAEDLARTEIAGYRYHLTKPINLAQLLGVIQLIRPTSALSRVATPSAPISP